MLFDVWYKYNSTLLKALRCPENELKEVLLEAADEYVTFKMNFVGLRPTDVKADSYYKACLEMKVDLEPAIKDALDNLYSDYPDYEGVLSTLVTYNDTSPDPYDVTPSAFHALNWTEVFMNVCGSDENDGEIKRWFRAAMQDIQ